MIDKVKLIAIIAQMAEDIVGSSEYLTQLDAEIGDGDHGINMARGFKLVSKQTQEMNDLEISDIFNKVAMTLLSNVGGASGPLFGTAFMRAATILKGKEEIDEHIFLDMLNKMVEGIEARGRASLGDKTILDSLIPARDAFKASIESSKDFLSSINNAVQAAQEGVEHTKTIIAKKGRASYLGDRSIGHADPGATSMAIVLRAFIHQMEKVA